MTTCFITQPIDPAAEECLAAHGIRTRLASRPTMAAAIAEVGDAQAVITRDLGFSAEAMASAPGLRIIASHGSGTNNVAIREAAARQIVVTRVPNANSRSVAEMTIALMLAAARRIPEADQSVRAENWSFRYSAQGMELHGLTLGLIGFGKIARIVAEIAGRGLGMHVVAWSPRVPPEIFSAHGVEQAPDAETLLSLSDVVSLHRPGDAPDAFLLDEAAFAHCRRGSILINTSRGSAVCQNALIRALEMGTLRVAALDVLPQEPPESTDQLITMKNVILSPHIGAATGASLHRMAMRCARQVIDCLQGRVPDDIVSV